MFAAPPIPAPLLFVEQHLVVVGPLVDLRFGTSSLKLHRTPSLSRECREVTWEGSRVVVLGVGLPVPTLFCF
jgi:hypothetical protein